MPGQKLTPEIPNARARRSVPTFRESPSSTHFKGQNFCIVYLLSVITLIFAMQCGKKLKPMAMHGIKAAMKVIITCFNWSGYAKEH